MSAGIDTRTSSLRLACHGVDRVPRLVGDAREPAELTTPAIVHVARSGALVGHAVLDLLEERPDLPVAQDLFARPASRDVVLTDELQREWRVASLGAMVLSKLRRDIIALHDRFPQRTAIAVSETLATEDQSALLESAELAGFTDCRLVPAAVAIAAGSGLHEHSGEKTALIADIHDGRLTASVVTAVNGQLRLIASESSNEAAGANVNQKVQHIIAQQFAAQHSGYDPQADPAAGVALKRHADALIRDLWSQNAASVQRSLLLGGRVQTVRMTKADLEPVLNWLLRELQTISAQAALSAGLTAASIDRVIATGSSAWVRELANFLSRSFPSPHQLTLADSDTDGLAACGASVLAANPGLTGDWLQPCLHENRCASFSIGLLVRHASGQTTTEILIQAEWPLPARASKTLFRSRSTQDSAVLALVAIRPETGDTVPLNPVRMPFAGEALTVDVEYSADGTITVADEKSVVTAGHLMAATETIDAAQRERYSTVRILN
ncbi:Hsp70 family protein [bacterium]|nr:Hsp70 family protein [bacterium]